MKLIKSSLLIMLSSCLGLGLTLAHAETNDFLTFLDRQSAISWTKMLANISVTGAPAGSVIASPSNSQPNYYFHWLRDSAVTMEAVRKHGDLGLFRDYLGYSSLIQNVNTPAGIGEPRFNLDGTADRSPWARPQGDGPALRAIGVLRYMAENADVAPTVSRLAQRDLDYIVGAWRSPTYDLWEETSGYHFFTLILQRHALQLGARAFVGDVGRASTYLSEASAIATYLNQYFWNEQKGLILPDATPTVRHGIASEGLDVQVILASVHLYDSDGFMDFEDDRVQASAWNQMVRFKNMYLINGGGKMDETINLGIGRIYNAITEPLRAKFAQIPGIGIGRYPEDMYDGAAYKYGNPWFFTTLAFAEMHYRLATRLQQHQKLAITSRNLGFFSSLAGLSAISPGLNLDPSKPEFALVIQGLKDRGDDFMKRVQAHLPTDGSMTEQFDQYDGHSMSARDLTWSYAGFLNAVNARSEIR